MARHCKEVDSTDICRGMVEYCKEMKKWGKRVRADIVNLERAVCELQKKAGVSYDFICDQLGDPGPPPDPPDWDD